MDFKNLNPRVVLIDAGWEVDSKDRYNSFEIVFHALLFELLIQVNVHKLKTYVFLPYMTDWKKLQQWFSSVFY